MEVKEILSKHNIEYKLATKDYVVKCLSPEHKDENPSCHIDKITGIFHCWSCGYSGSIYNEFNVEVPNLVNRKVEFLKNKINKLMWSKPLQIPLDAAPINYEYRDISKETLNHFEAFTSDDKDLDMEGRIIFPLRDINGHIRVFVGRYMWSELDPKYKFYPPHVEIPLYPEIPSIEEGSIILVEGIFDMLNLWDKGLKNVIFCSGVNIGLVKNRAKRKRNIERLLPFKYQGIHTLNILFDGDKAGRGAAEGLKSYAEDIFNINIIPLEDGKDPGSLSEKEVIDIREKLYG